VLRQAKLVALPFFEIEHRREDLPSRAAAIRRLVELGLKAKGKRP
jgi:hypothetical protein